MQTYYHRFQKVVASVLLIALTSCSVNPSHRPTIGGSIELINDIEEELCFSPQLETAYLTSTVAFDDLEFINLSYIKVLLGKDPLDDKVVWEAFPKSEIYYQLKKGEAICMNQNDSELTIVKYKKLDNNSDYTVVVGGRDDKKKYNLRFIKRFKYPIQKN